MELSVNKRRREEPGAGDIQQRAGVSGRNPGDGFCCGFWAVACANSKGLVGSVSSWVPSVVGVVMKCRQLRREQNREAHTVQAPSPCASQEVSVLFYACMYLQTVVFVWVPRYSLACCCKTT